eukprot:4285335-Amphidinium_carterae.1
MAAYMICAPSGEPHVGSMVLTRRPCCCHGPQRPSAVLCTREAMVCILKTQLPHVTCKLLFQSATFGGTNVFDDPQLQLPISGLLDSHMHEGIKR